MVLSLTVASAEAGGLGILVVEDASGEGIAAVIQQGLGDAGVSADAAPVANARQWLSRGAVDKRRLRGFRAARASLQKGWRAYLGNDPARADKMLARAEKEAGRIFYDKERTFPDQPSKEELRT